MLLLRFWRGVLGQISEAKGGISAAGIVSQQEVSEYVNLKRTPESYVALSKTREVVPSILYNSVLLETTQTSGYGKTENIWCNFRFLLRSVSDLLQVLVFAARKNPTLPGQPQLRVSYSLS